MEKEIEAGPGNEDFRGRRLELVDEKIHEMRRNALKRLDKAERELRLAMRRSQTIRGASAPPAQTYHVQRRY